MNNIAFFVCEIKKKISLKVLGFSLILFSSSVNAAVNLLIDQGTTIPNGMRLCDASGSYCVDLTSSEPPSTEGANFTPATPRIFGSGTTSVQNTELVIINYDTANSPIPFNLEVLNIGDVDSLTDGATSTSVRDAYSWSQSGTWATTTTAVVSIDTTAANNVGSFIINDPQGDNNLNEIGQFTILPAGASDVLLNMEGPANNHDVTFTLDAPTTSVDLYAFNSGGGGMFWFYTPSMIVTLPDTTLFKTVTNDDGGSALANAWTLEANTGGGAVEVSGTDGVQVEGLVPGVYTLSENGGPVGYELTGISCSNANPAGTNVSGTTLINPNFTLATGDAISCMFTNDDIGTDLQIIKSHLPVNPEVGQVVTFELIVTNNGPNDATAVVIGDEILAGFSFVSASMTGGNSQNQTAPNLQWTIDNLPVGAANAASLTYQATIVTP